MDERSEWKGRRIHDYASGNIAAVLGGHRRGRSCSCIVNPWFAVDPKESRPTQIVTVAFWVSFIALLVVLFEMRKEPGGETVEIEGPAFTRFLFSNSRAGLFWLPIRLFLGFAWLEAGWHKLERHRLDRRRHRPAGLLGARRRDPAAGPAARPITFEWYRDFINSCSTTTPTPGSPRSSSSVSSRSGSASCSAS